MMIDKFMKSTDNILLVEDEPGVLQTFAEWLQSSGFDIKVYQARDADIKSRSAAESGLSGALGLLLEDSQHLATAADSALLTELSALTDKIRVAIALHTDAVSRTQMVRSKFIVRIFRLAGTAPLPVTYEFESDVLSAHHYFWCCNLFALNWVLSCCKDSSWPGSY
jgi:CheY-like chemotaxis protein